MLRISTFVLLALTLALGAAASSAAAAPPESQVESLDNALLESMKAGPTSTATSRYRNLAPVVEKVFDLRAMTAFAVGPAWGGFSTEEQQAAIAAFTRLTIASYAHNFHEFGGEKFEIDPNVVTRGPDKIVQTKLFSPAKEPTSLNYRMRNSTGAWKIIDVYYGSISQLTIRRSDFAAPLAAAGAKGLIAHLNSLSDDLIK
jgi:phospholipid transport system substrate-binding protein